MEKKTVRNKRLYLEDLTVSFDGFKALNNLSLYVDPGEMLCIIGPNGAGKTTMMDVITGKTRPDSGTAWFGDGIDLLHLSEPEIVAAGIGRKFQKPELLLVDEPVAGMTPHEIERTAQLLLSLAGEHSIVVVEHDMSFVRSIARRVTVLHEGQVIAEGNMDKVQKDPRVIEVYLGV